jgi:hypothetical protein
MRFLADESMPGPAVAALRAHGHDVLWVRESKPGASDAVVLELAQRDRRVLVTADTDFGELAFHSGLPAECGVVLVRLDWAEYLSLLTGFQFLLLLVAVFYLAALVTRKTSPASA